MPPIGGGGSSESLGKGKLLLAKEKQRERKGKKKTDVIQRPVRNPIRCTRNPTSVSLQEEDLVQKPSVICTGQDQQEQHDDCSREEQQRQDTESQAYEKRLVKKNEPRPHTTKIIFLKVSQHITFFFFRSRYPPPPPPTIPPVSIVSIHRGGRGKGPRDKRY